MQEHSLGAESVVQGEKRVILGRQVLRCLLRGGYHTAQTPCKFV
jgi:hypothetical protein